MTLPTEKIFTIRLGDRKPYLAYRFPFPLTGAVSVDFSAREAKAATPFIDRQPAQIADGTYTINGESMVLSPDDQQAVVFYPWAEADTAQERESCQFLFHITWPPGMQETVPSEGYGRFKIGDNF